MKTLLEHGSDPNQANEKGLTPADTCKDSAILEFLKENTKETTKEQREEEEEYGRADDGGTELAGEEEMEEEEGDEDVFEAKKESELPEAIKRGETKPATHEGERESHLLEEGPLPSKAPLSARKQLKDNFSSDVLPSSDQHHTNAPSDAVENAGDVNGAGDGTSLTKLIGKATPFFSDISSSESESELPDVKLNRITERRKASLELSSQEEEEGEGKEEKGTTDSLKEKKEEEGGGDPPSTKEEAMVKMHVATEEEEGMAERGEW